MSQDKDYIFGTHDEEILRLGLQHRVWRPRSTEAWRKAGFKSGKTVLDIGCGPGYASLDLAEIVGETGKVISIDRSQRFLNALKGESERKGLSNIETHEVDFNTDEIPEMSLDGAWARWVFAFLRDPRKLLADVAQRIKTGGSIVLHEYFHYTTWQVIPNCPEISEFVQIVSENWRAEGGEPNIALNLLPWLQELGFEIKHVAPIIEIVPVGNYFWEWPSSFLEIGLRRLIDLGRITSERAEEIIKSFKNSENSPNSWMITPAVMEIIAMKKN